MPQQKSKYSNKRNQIQIANDRKLAIELLSTGKNYVQIAAHICSVRDYTLSDEQVRQDVSTVKEELIASALQHGLENIAKELEEIAAIKKRANSAAERLSEEHRSLVPMLRLIMDVSARETHLRGGENWIKAQLLNESIERVIAAGFVVSDPTEANQA